MIRRDNSSRISSRTGVPPPGDVVYQKRLKKERRARKRLQEQLDLEIKRRTQLEEALKATGASSEQVRAITENVTAEARTSSEPPEASPVHSQSQQQSSQQQPPQQPLQQQQAAAAQQYREAQVPRPSQQPSTPEKPAWGYGLDLIGSQASAFWQNYQGQSLPIRTAHFSARLSAILLAVGSTPPPDRGS
ncbi:hypothetical protein HN011_012067 [Eciton burchellii]|nr:hypothetical protein HN011_012067 [Eciton burchellii]